MAGQLIDLEIEEETIPEEISKETDPFATEEVVSEEQQEPEEDLPEKYQGKTIAEVARMHGEAEKALGRQSNEVGELRHAFDEFVTSSVASKDEPPTEEIDFFLDPDGAVERAISNHPKLKEAEAVTAEMKKRSSLASLQANFPKMNETLANPAFNEWVNSSPIRKRLYRDADKSFDYDSAAELFSNWNERANVVEQTKVVEKEARKQDIKNASTGSTRANPDGRRQKKVFRRTDIIRLMKTDPDRYEAMSDEIMAAYKEGRVK